MTDHNELTMHREKVRISDKDMITAILKRCHVATVCLHDEPYPYCVPMNYGFEWKEKLVFYFHMAIEGHRIELLKQNPNVSLSVYEFLDRQGYRIYRKENHDYRSVNVFGKGEIITTETPEEYLHGMSVLCKNNNRSPVRKISNGMKNRLFVLRITADIVTAKSQYPISSLEEVPIPPNEPKA